MKILRRLSFLAVSFWGCIGLFSSMSPARAGAISGTNSITGLFDASVGNRQITFTGFEPGFGNGVIADVNISINYAKADGEAFNPPFPTFDRPFFNEIHFAIIAPNGMTVELIAANSFNEGAGGTNFDATQTFDQQAANVVNVNLDLPAAGSFRPTGPGSLNDFNGFSALGTWTLFIEDTVIDDALRFRSFTLNIITDVFSVPEPTSLLLLTLGIVGLTLRRRRFSN
ncbi:MAG: PEP-CTERM sorting domain-containing protein [Deltaproteobacteria bacterium]|nr:PEP-CTERM sorting domain-containing protein [Deltaproteobacteria bacterium]